MAEVLGGDFLKVFVTARAVTFVNAIADRTAQRVEGKSANIARVVLIEVDVPANAVGGDGLQLQRFPVPRNNYAAIAIDQSSAQNQLSEGKEAMPSGDVAIIEPSVQIRLNVLVEGAVARAGLVGKRACNVNDKVRENRPHGGKVIV